MRELKFDESNKDAYDLIYEGITASEKTFKSGDLRTIAKVYTKLEELGKVEEKRPIFHFEKAGSVLLEEVEYILLKDALEQVSWNALGARRAAPILEWLESLPDAGLKKV